MHIEEAKRLHFTLYIRTDSVHNNHGTANQRNATSSLSSILASSIEHLMMMQHISMVHWGVDVMLFMVRMTLDRARPSQSNIIKTSLQCAMDRNMNLSKETL